MKIVKKIIAALLAVLTAFLCSVGAFADEGEKPATDEIVARISLCSCIYLFPIVGHTWVYVENLSDSVQRVGCYDVPVGQGVSVGSFAFSAHDGWGIYYNLEAYRENRDNNMQNHWSVSKELTQSELDKLSDHILNYINFWGFYTNCAFFSFTSWNAATGSLWIPLVIPAISQLEVIMAGGKKGVLEMYCPNTEQVFRQHGIGSSAYLVPVSEKTINS